MRDYNDRVAAIVVRDTAYAAASDAKAGCAAEAWQRHRDRMAAMQRHFGQQNHEPRQS
jgi:hypothetical protein